jgi:cytochrome c-type biogenesis protein CcmH
VSVFILYAMLLTLIAVAAVLWPLALRRDETPPNWAAAGAGALIVMLGAALLYPVWSKWDWSEARARADAPAAMVGRLARHLEREPNDLEGWLSLGRAYAAIELYPLSARAYERADKLAGGRNAAALTGLAEALVLAGQSGLDDRAGRLFEQALELDPDSAKSLFYSALAALERRDFVLAKERFDRLLTSNPPPEIRQIIEEQVRVLSGVIAGSAAAAVVSVPLKITLNARVANQAAADAPLFIVARVPGQRGAPLAALRLQARFPQEIDLKDSDAVMGGSGFAPGQELEIEARVANGGNAISSSGDPFGTLVLRVGADKGRLTLDINQLKP